MSTYKRVFSPDGVRHDVSELRAAELILNHGWTQQPVTTVVVEEEKPAPKRRSCKKKPEPVEEPKFEDIPADVLDAEEQPEEDVTADEPGDTD